MQYFTGVPALLVGIHVVGAVVVMWASTVLLLDTRRARQIVEHPLSAAWLPPRVPPDDAAGRGSSPSKQRAGDASCRLLLGLLVALVRAARIADGASPQDDVAIQVQVKDQQRDATGKANNQPVAGVTVTVLDASGAEVAHRRHRRQGRRPHPGAGARPTTRSRSTRTRCPTARRCRPRRPAEQQVTRRLVRSPPRRSSTSSPARARAPSSGRLEQDRAAVRRRHPPRPR